MILKIFSLIMFVIMIVNTVLMSISLKDKHILIKMKNEIVAELKIEQNKKVDNVKVDSKKVDNVQVVQTNKETQTTIDIDTLDKKIEDMNNNKEFQLQTVTTEIELQADKMIVNKLQGNIEEMFKDGESIEINTGIIVKSQEQQKHYRWNSNIYSKYKKAGLTVFENFLNNELIIEIHLR